jgi:hypothetical protein
VGLTSGTASPPQSAPPPALPGTPEFNLHAFLAAKRVVSATLRAPATAHFPSAGVAVFRDRRTDTYLVTGNVDSQNAAGAMLRQPYQVRLRLLCGGAPERGYSRECWESIQDSVHQARH